MDIKVGRNWGLFAAGIALVIIGFVLLMVPGLTLVSIAVIAGCMFLAAGIVDAYAYFKYREAEGLSGWALAYAICDIILGVLFIVHPVASAVVIPWVMGIFVVAYGIFEIVAAVRFHSVLPGWGWVLFAGIVSLFCGIAFFLWPGTFALFLGFFLMAAACRWPSTACRCPRRPSWRTPTRKCDAPLGSRTLGKRCPLGEELAALRPCQ